MEEGHAAAELDHEDHKRAEALAESDQAKTNSFRNISQALAALLQLVESAITIQDISSTEDEARQLVQAAQSVFGCEIASIVQIDLTTGRLIPLATKGQSTEEANFWRTSLITYRLDQYYSPDQIRRFQRGETVLSDHRYLTEQGLPGYGMEDGAHAPLMEQGQVVGLLSIGFRSQQHAFSPDEMTLLAGIARLASLFLQRERLLHERAAAQARALALKETYERMDEFLSIAGHELRTPITAIKSSIQLMLRRLEREALNGSAQQSALRPDLLQRTDQQIQRLTRLLDDMLDLSRIRAGKLELRLERCDLAALAREAVEREARAHPERSILLEGGNDGPIPIFGDSDRIAQVITNYLTNALKYSAVEQPVNVRIRRDARTVTLEVQDQGPGIPPGEQARIWNLFHRVPGISVQSGSGVGLGLGLHISKTLIEQHNGHVGVTSMPGEGSTFWFTLPLAQENT